MKNVDRREKLILDNIVIARHEASRAFRKHRGKRSETRDDFISIAIIILIRAVDYCIRKDWYNSEAWLRKQIRRDLNRYCERHPDKKSYEFKDYHSGKCFIDPGNLIDLAIKFKKDKSKRHSNNTKTREALNADRFEFFAPEYFK